MAEDTPTTKPTPDAPKRNAGSILIEFLKKNNMSIIVRRQQVRYLEDNGMVIEPPNITIFYNDELENKLNKKDETPPRNAGIELPSKPKA